MKYESITKKCWSISNQILFNFQPNSLTRESANWVRKWCQISFVHILVIVLSAGAAYSLQYRLRLNEQKASTDVIILSLSLSHHLPINPKIPNPNAFRLFTYQYVFVRFIIASILRQLRTRNKRASILTHNTIDLIPRKNDIVAFSLLFFSSACDK